ncbi:MAG: ATP-binding protein [Deltaproteobacteria bacterium]|nr:ATP-binding protein [Deltaproteobacteria bacterium]
MTIFQRNILKELNIWKNNRERKPLIIRGARQTGKTVAVELFGKTFSNFISLNLERDSDRKLFEQNNSVETVCQGIELLKGKNPFQPNTLLFIDEIQNSGRAIELLRFFYEDRPEIFVICAGSLLEAVMRKEGFSFPVGRVEFLYMYPMTFDEYLVAAGKENILNKLNMVTLNDRSDSTLHGIASELFNEYAFVGGMPAVVSDFLEKKSYTSIADIKESILTALKDDVSKYSRTSESKYLRHVIEYAPYSVGGRIKYEKFGNSLYKSREIKHAFELLEYAMVVQRVYGSPATEPPSQPHFGVSPKIVYLDSGLVVHKLGLTFEARSAGELNSLFRGGFTEQIVGQALLAENLRRRNSLCFWYRNTKSSIAETDYSYLFENKLIPIGCKVLFRQSFERRHMLRKAKVHFDIYSVLSAVPFKRHLIFVKNLFR